MYCVIDLHNYHRYRGQLLGTSGVPIYTITNVWYRLAGVFKNNQRVVFGTMNEPYGVSYEEALRGANAAISGIRGVGATVRSHFSTSFQLSLGSADMTLRHGTATDHDQWQRLLSSQFVGGHQQQVDGTGQH